MQMVDSKCVVYAHPVSLSASTYLVPLEHNPHFWDNLQPRDRVGRLFVVGRGFSIPKRFIVTIGGDDSSVHSSFSSTAFVISTN